jgi:hypothetical protein
MLERLLAGDRPSEIRAELARMHLWFRNIVWDQEP